MTRLVAVSNAVHGPKVWRKPSSFRFAAKDPIAPIVLAEVGHVGSGMPTVFIKQAGRYDLMALMSPIPNQNLFVGPDGQWLGGYVPSSLRTYPFRLVRSQGSEQMTLCIDEDSGLVADADEKGENFFTSDGKPSPTVAQLMEFLRQIEANRMATDLAVVSLAEAGVIEPWPLQIENAGGKKTASNGLHRISEKALNALDDESFLKLRKTGALALAYAQLMSMVQVARFAQLAQLRQQLAQTPEFKPEEIFKTKPTDLIRFD